MGKNKFLTIKNLSDTKSEIYLYGDIVSSDWEKWSESDVCPEDIKNAISAIGNRSVDIHIYSAGGSVFAGEAIRAMLVRLSGHKTVYIDGLAASIASVIAMCYDELHISQGSYMVIHNPSTYSWGTADELRKTADTLDLIKQTIVETYTAKLSEDFDSAKLNAMLDEETWLTSQDVSNMFKNVIIDEPAGQLTAKLDNNMLNCYNKVPKDLILPEKTSGVSVKALKDALDREHLDNYLKILKADTI